MEWINEYLAVLLFTASSPTKDSALFYSKADISEMDITEWGFYKDFNFEVKHGKELRKNEKS